VNTNETLKIRASDSGGGIDTIRYDTGLEFSVDSKDECVQLNLAYVARKNIKKKLSPLAPTVFYESRSKDIPR